MCSSDLRCSKCGETKPVEEFSLNRRRKDGRCWWCKRCCQADYLSRRPPGHQVRPCPKQRNHLSLDLTEKRCARCALVKPVVDFGRDKNQPDGRNPRCLECLRADMSRRRSDPEFRRRASLRNKQWYERSREKRLAAGKAANEQLRGEVLDAYGGRCTCCGESTREFLAVDHVNGGGVKHRKQLRLTGRGFYLWLKRQGFPRDEFRLLCHNCNIARGHYGYCPHERMA